MSINLVNKTGKEQTLEATYSAFMKKQDPKKAKYVHFDFHHECKGMKFYKVYSTLCKTLEKDIADQGYYSSSNAGKIITTQSGVMRNNCADCLDRTK